MSKNVVFPIYYNYTCDAIRGAAQAIADSVWTNITLNTADRWDPQGMHDPAGANPERVNILVTGYYLVAGIVYWAPSAGGTLRGIQSYSDVGVIGFCDYTFLSNIDFDQNAAHIQYFTAGQYVTMQVYQNCGAPLNVSNIIFGVHLLSPSV